MHSHEDKLHVGQCLFEAPAGVELKWTGDAVIGRDYMADVQTSLDRFCKAKDRKPIWNDVNGAAKFVGPAIITR